MSDPQTTPAPCATSHPPCERGPALMPVTHEEASQAAGGAPMGLPERTRLHRYIDEQAARDSRQRTAVTTLQVAVAEALTERDEARAALEKQTEISRQLAVQVGRAATALDAAGIDDDGADLATRIGALVSDQPGPATARCTRCNEECLDYGTIPGGVECLLCVTDDRAHARHLSTLARNETARARRDERAAYEARDVFARAVRAALHAATHERSGILSTALALVAEPEPQAMAHKGVAAQIATAPGSAP